MNATELLAQFERIGDAPDVVPRLRRFILDLAVRGKLVPQDPKDEPATQMVKRIAAEKARLARAGDLRSERPLPILSKADLSFSLPHGWAWVRLGELSKLVTSGSRDWAQHYSSEGAIFVRMGNLSKDHYHLRLDHIQRVNPPNDGEGTRTRLEAGDILVSITGDVGMLGLIPDGFGEAYINQHTAMVRPMPQMKGRYLAELFRSPFAQDQFNKPQRGIKNSFRLTDVTQFVVPLPPLAEQHRIVAMVDELMTLCDGLEAARAERETRRDRLTAASLSRLNTPDPDSFQDDARFALGVIPAITARVDQVKQLRQTILNLAVRGKLVPQDPKEGTATDLLALLKKARGKWEEEGRIRKEKATIPALTLEENYSAVPQSWAWARIVELGQPQTGTSPSSGNRDLFGSHIPFVKPADLDGIEINYNGPGLSRLGVEHSRFIPENSVMMVCIGATLGKTNRNTRPVCCNQQINSLTPFVNGLAEYLVIALKSCDFQALAWSKAGTGTLPIISKGKWELLPVPIPPLAEQHRIVVKVGELMTMCDRLEASLAAGDERRRGLLNALLNEALRPAQERDEAA